MHSFAGRSRQVERQAYPVKVNHLPPGCPDKLVRDLFSKYGRIVSLKVNRGPSESYAYVNFSALESALRAEAEMNGHVVHGRALTIGKNQPEAHFTLKIVKLPAGVDEEELSLLCGRFGSAEVKINAGSEGNYAYLNFRDGREASRALDYLNGQLLYSERLKVKWHSRPPPVQQVLSGPAGATAALTRYANLSPPVALLQSRQCLRGVPLPQPVSSTVKVLIQGKGITAQNLQDIFIQYGTIIRPIIIQPGAPDYAYVNFSSPSEASQALLRGNFFLNGVAVIVKSSTKQFPSIVKKDSRQVQDSDSLISLLLTTTYLGEASRRAKPFEVIVKPVKNGEGLLISGNSEDVSQAEQHLGGLISLIKEAVIVEIMTLHCKTIPVFANLTRSIQQLATEKKVEFAVMKINGATMCLSEFSSTIASFSQGADPMLYSTFCGLLTASGTPKDNPPPTNICWEFMDDSGRFLAMSHSYSQDLEKMFQCGRSLSTSWELCLDKWRYAYDFQAMTQTNVSTKKVRRIRRNAPTGMSECYFQIQCRGLPGDTGPGTKALDALLLSNMLPLPIPLHQCNAKAEEVLAKLAHKYCVEVVSSSPQQIVIEGARGYVEVVSLKLKEEALEFRSDASGTSSKFPFPPTWELPATNLELKPVRRHSTEWNDVEEKMRESMATVSMTKLERIQNPWLWEKYAFCKQRMAKKNHGVVNEKLLFHGTRETKPDKVFASEHGFDFRYGSNGLWGHGAYFAVKASYSAKSFAYQNALGFRQILLALVLTGESVLLPSNSQLKKPPVKRTSSGQVALVDELYDSVQGHNAGSDMYIVYDHDKAYPAYLITFY